MTASITPAPDGSYVDVFVPISFKRFGGRKTIVAPDGSQLAPDRSKATDRTLIKALSRAYRWQKLLDEKVTPADADKKYVELVEELKAKYGVKDEASLTDAEKKKLADARA